VKRIHVAIAVLSDDFIGDDQRLALVNRPQAVHGETGVELALSIGMKFDT
jgi:hypothetical protein